MLRRPGGADVAIGLAVDDQSFAAAYAGLRRGGRLVPVALPASGMLRVPVFDAVLNGTSVMKVPREGSIGPCPAPRVLGDHEVSVS